MTYNRLKKVMIQYRLGNKTRIEMECAIALWQMREYGKVAEWPQEGVFNEYAP